MHIQEATSAPVQVECRQMSRLLPQAMSVVVVFHLVHASSAYAEDDTKAQEQTLATGSTGEDSTPSDPAHDAPAAEKQTSIVPPSNYAVPPPPIGPLYPGPANLGIVLGDDEEAPRIPARIGTRLRVLGTDLDALASRSSGGLGSGVMSILTGGLSIALAQLIDQPAVRTFLYVFGTTSLIRGGLELTLSPDAESAALSFSHLPMRVPEEVMDRLRYGEQALADVASDSRRLRMLDGAVSIATGAITVPFLLLGPDNPKTDSKFDTLDLFVVVGAGVSVLSGVVSLLSSSEAEKRNEAYQNLKARLAKPPKTHAPPHLTISASPGLVALWMRGQITAL